LYSCEQKRVGVLPDDVLSWGARRLRAAASCTAESGKYDVQMFNVADSAGRLVLAGSAL
jgi:hypothetical protein